ncbi:type II toxin-antitoxin system RelE/ParE family toxin [Desulfobacterales bacterium HSG17]|nr:type II toxin-antitoxin system RelE/ParE family toxin [Desulfobacterales bacterium HSG17]
MIKIKNVIQSPLFERQKKKLHKNQIRDLDNAVIGLIENPEKGSMKVGDLSGITHHSLNTAGLFVISRFL